MNAEQKIQELDHKNTKYNKIVTRRRIKKFLWFGLIGSAIILLLLAYGLAERSKTMVNCIFCDIVAGKSANTQIEVETDDYVIFKDIKPASTYHYLCIPKNHIDSLKTMTKEDIPLVNRMEEGLKNFFKSLDIDINDALFGFHMPPLISVKHLHMHGIAPRSTMSLMNSFTFKPSSYWFKTVQDARDYLNNKSQN